MDTNDFMTRGRVSSQQSNTSTQDTGRKHRGPRGVMKFVMAGMIISVAILVASVIAFVVFGGGKSENELIKASQYQAVFLNNQSGQVFFGRLSLVNSRFYRLTDVYYVKVDQAQASDNTEDSQKISLAKRGNELHGPEDEMFIAKDKVLFWENLKNDGKVVKAIIDYKTNGNKETTK
jgi:hypothetical protein